MIPESRFLEWFVAYESDCEEARADIDERFEQLLDRLELPFDDEKVELLRDFLFNGYEP